MSYVDDRETFFTPHTPDKDTAMPTPHLMTAQYVDELVYKQPGLAVVDKDGDTWGWIIDRHKGETGWVVGDTHDDRMQALRDGAHIQPKLPVECEKYEYVEENPYTTCVTQYPAPTADDADDDWSDCEPHTGFTVEKHTYTVPPVQLNADDDYIPSMGERLFTDHMHVPVNDPVKPYIIAVEGIDGAGKNTYTQKLAALLNAQVESFPQYGLTESAKLIEEALRGEAKFYDPWHMAQLFAADRKESAGLLTGPGVIIVDRYVASNAAYLHAKTGYHGAFDAMETLEYDTLGLPKPDLHIFVDTPVTVAMGRVKSRAESEGGEPDVNETDQGLQERVRASYLKMVESQWVSPWIVIDGQAQS